jgi:hypothetical protein
MRYRWSATLAATRALGSPVMLSSRAEVGKGEAHDEYGQAGADAMPDAGQRARYVAAGLNYGQIPTI